ncbi:MAG TPA: tetratricopeptide repeat protein, partial [Longimicrobiaceae bacterium]
MDHLRTRPLLRLAVALLAAGCAAPSAPPAAAPPADLARLESAVARTPRDPGALVSLAAAYEERERWDDARAAYRRALDARPPAGAATRVRDRLLL